MDKKLIKLLAQTDARFYPVRSDKSGLWAGAYCARRDYLSEGLQHGGGGTVRQRKAAHEELDEMLAGGLVERHGGGIRLSALGADRARALVCMPLMWQSIEQCERLKAVDAKMAKVYGDKYSTWIPEIVMIEDSWGNDQTRRLIELEHRMLPALVSGYAITNTDGAGGVYYKCTDVPLPAPDYQCEGIAGTESRLDYYLREWEMALAEVAEWRRGGEIGPWGLVAERGWDFIAKYEAMTKGGGA